MAITTRQPELLLSFDEFVDTWVQLISEFYQRGISDDGIYLALDLDEQGAMRFPMELCTVILVLAMRTWSAKRLHEGSRERVLEAVVGNAYRHIFAEDEETLAACMEFYRARYAMFMEILPGGSKNEKQLRQELIGFSRYTVSQCSARPEAENAGIIERLSILLITAAGSFERLMHGSTLDGNSAFVGKPKFIVRKL